MINFRTANHYLILFIIIVFVFSILHLFGLTIIEIGAYTALFLGISIFYSAYLKQYKSGIVLGAILFLMGSIFFVISRYEILNIGSIFVPMLLIIIGLSLLVGNILTKNNFVTMLFSILSLIAGVWQMVARGSTTVDGFLSAFYAVLKSYWIIIVVSVLIIFVITKNFKKKNVDQ